VSATIVGSCQLKVPAYVREASELDNLPGKSKCAGAHKPTTRVSVEAGRVRYDVEF
jgi:hypothetical protein